MSPLAQLTPEEEIARLKMRVGKLAEEKSYLQLVIRLMEQINPLAGLDDMVRNLLYSIVETIGGTNIKLYYWIEDELHYIDFMGENKIIEDIDDPVIRQVQLTREFVEESCEASDALLHGTVLPGSWTWTFPLLVGKELVGIIRLENVNIIGSSLRNYLPIFFSHVALILSNEVRSLTRQKAEAALHESEARYRELIEGIHVGIVVHAADTRVLDFNPQALEYLGLSAEQMRGRSAFHPDWKFLDEHGAPLPVEDYPVNQALKSSFILRNMVLGVVRPNRSDTIWLLVNADPVRDAQGQLEQVRVSFIDITSKKLAEDELALYRNQLEQLVADRTVELVQARDTAESANRMKSVFLANMSHELRTPLNAILGFAQIMARDQRIPEDERNNLDTINRSGRHLLSLINDVLEISRIEAGRLSVQLQPCDLHELLRSVNEIIELRARDKGLALQLEIDSSVPQFVLTDPGKLRQILINLLTNAVKYTEQGNIALTATAAVNDRQARLELTVSDTGVGISVNELQLIFDPFYQTEQGVALGEGTGLGLTISRSYAQLLGGELQVKSEPGKGSAFTLGLPVQLADALVAQALHRGRVLGLAPGQRSYRILVVEDDPDSQRLLEAVLQQAEFEVRTADNGLQAVTQFRDWHPDFIWLDMRMPVMNGYEAARQIRALPGGDQVKIAALTASVFIESREEILASGCDAVLSKPLEEQKLFELMGQLLGLQYRYADEVPCEEPPLPEQLDLSGLPAELREELLVAAQLLDLETASSLIERIAQSDPELANGLDALVKGYRFDQIVVACSG